MLTLRAESFHMGVEPAKRPLAQMLSYGVVAIDKPRGPSSHEVSAFVRKMLSLSRTGHSGTLDPDVSGVLPVMLAHSCKAAGYLLAQTKSYVCVMRTFEPCSREQLESAFSHFRGKIYQTPPIASAVRKQLRTRTIHALTLHEVDERLVLFFADVEAGTYIRKLVTDAGLVLGMRTSMDELRRTKAGQFKEADCISLQELSDRYWLAQEKGDEAPLRQAIHPIESALSLPKVILSDAVVPGVCTGINPSASTVCSLDPRIEMHQVVGLYTGKGELVAIARALEDSKSIAARAKGDSQPTPSFDVLRVVHTFG